MKNAFCQIVDTLSLDMVRFYDGVALLAETCTVQELEIQHLNNGVASRRLEPKVTLPRLS